MGFGRHLSIFAKSGYLSTIVAPVVGLIVLGDGDEINDGLTSYSSIRMYFDVKLITHHAIRTYAHSPHTARIRSGCVMPHS